MKRAELRGHFCFVHHDDLALGDLGDDFLVEQRAASSFDQVELRVDFVGAVDRDVDHRGTLGVDKRQSGLACGAGDVARRGEGAETGQFAGGIPAGDFPDGVDRGGTGAQPHDHAWLDKTHGIHGGGMFEGVPVL